MDSKHRHDLEQGDLERFIFHFGEWWAKWGTHTLIVVVVILASYLSFNYWRTRQRDNHERTWGDMAQETTATGFRGIANENKGTFAEALAYLRGGDVLLSEATFGKPDADLLSKSATAPATKAAREPADLLKEAEAMYRAALAAPKADATVRLNASLGLASIAESRTDYKQARESYTQIARDAAGVSPPIQQTAQSRLKAIDRLEAPMIFSPEPPPMADPLTSSLLPSLAMPSTQPAATAP